MATPGRPFVIWDQAADGLQLCRAPYDVARAQAKIREAHLLELLAERLEMGR